jgi:uncharacterized protein YjbJ (UPF0337 family)
MRKIVLAMLVATFGVAAPLAMTHAQTAKTSTEAKVTNEANEAWAKVKGAWTQTKGEVKVQWGKLTDDDIAQIDGRREVLVGKIETRYGVSREEAERQVGGFERKHR